MKDNERTLAYQFSDPVNLDELESISGGKNGGGMTQWFSSKPSIIAGKQTAQVEYKWDW